MSIRCTFNLSLINPRKKGKLPGLVVNIEDSYGPLDGRKTIIIIETAQRGKSHQKIFFFKSKKKSCLWKKRNLTAILSSEVWQRRFGFSVIRSDSPAHSFSAHCYHGVWPLDFRSQFKLPTLLKARPYYENCLEIKRSSFRNNGNICWWLLLYRLSSPLQLWSVSSSFTIAQQGKDTVQ